MKSNLLSRVPPTLAGLSLCLLAGCQTHKSATVTGEHQFAAASGSKPAVIYVADFELPPDLIEHQDNMLSGRPGPVGRVGDRLAGTSTDRAARARELVELMSSSLLKDLAKAGFTAARLDPGAPVPAQGWLVRGSFTAVDEGNRLRRSMIGMGQGQTDIKVLSCVDDLSQGPPRPLYQIATDANSGSTVGAAPTMALSPYGAAVHFIRAGTDIEKNVKATASQIAAQVAQRVQPKPPAAAK